MAGTLTQGITNIDHISIEDIVSKDADGFPLETSYAELIAGLGFIGIAWEEIGSYQGDYLVALYDPKTKLYGFTIIGYGSCSGCDALLAASRAFFEIYHLLKDICSRIGWGEKEEVIEYLSGKNSENDWRWKEPSYQKSMKNIIDMIKIFSEPDEA